MNKNIMCFINGLGVEQKNSADAYNAQVMPNLEKMVTTNLFTSLETSATDYASGYQVFNTGTNSSLTEDYLKKVYNNDSWKQAKNYQTILDILNSNEERIHIFCSINDKNSYDYLKSFLTNISINKQIIIHLVLTQVDINDYKVVNNFIDRMRFEPIKNTEIGIIFGINILHEESLKNRLEEFNVMLIKKVGEQWTNPSQKFDIYKNKNITPNNANPIYVSNDANLKSNETILFFNYKSEDYTNLIKLLTDQNSHFSQFITMNTFKYASIFPLKNINGITSLFDNLSSETSLSAALKQVDSKVLVLVDKENYDTVRFMNNGLTNEVSPNISYMLVDNNILFNQQQMSAIINNPDYQNIIINFRIDNCTDFNNLQDTMRQIDMALAYIKQECENKYRLIITSLFGFTKEMLKDNINVLVNFKGKIPLIVIDNTINRSKFKLQSYESTAKLLPTFIKSIKPDLKVASLIVSKSFLTKILYK